MCGDKGGGGGIVFGEGGGCKGGLLDEGDGRDGEAV